MLLAMQQQRPCKPHNRVSGEAERRETFAPCLDGNPQPICSPPDATPRLLSPNRVPRYCRVGHGLRERRADATDGKTTADSTTSATTRMMRPRRTRTRSPSSTSPGASRVEVAYRALEERLNRFASLAADLGLKPGERLAMSVGNRFEFIEIMYGAMRAGVVPVPLNTRLGADVLASPSRTRGAAGIVEPASQHSHRRCRRQGRPRGQAVIRSCAARLAALRGRAAGRLRGLRSSAPGFGSSIVPALHLRLDGPAESVVLTHAGQLWWIRAVQRYWPLAPDERALAAVPLYHKNAMAGAVKPMLHAGGSVVLLPNFEPRRFLQALSDWPLHAHQWRAGGVHAAAAAEGPDRASRLPRRFAVWRSVRRRRRRNCRTRSRRRSAFRCARATA